MNYPKTRTPNSITQTLQIIKLHKIFYINSVTIIDKENKLLKGTVYNSLVLSILKFKNAPNLLVYKH